jgi:hypothetical protein
VITWGDVCNACDARKQAGTFNPKAPFDLRGANPKTNEPNNKRTEDGQRQTVRRS